MPLTNRLVALGQICLMVPVNYNLGPDPCFVSQCVFSYIF